MNLINLAINILWLLIGVIIILGIVWLAIYVVSLFVPLPGKVVQAVWAVVLILILIAILSLFAGGGGNIRPFRWGGIPSGAFAALSFAAIGYHSMINYAKQFEKDVEPFKR